MNVGEIAQDLCIVDSRALFGDFDMASAPVLARLRQDERRKQHEEIGRPVAFVLVVVPRWLSCSHGFRCARFGDELL